MRAFEIIAGTLPGCVDSGVAIAASRWGAGGLLNLEGASAADAERAMTRFVRHGRGSMGVKLDARPDLLGLVDALPGHAFVVLATCASADWHRLVPAVRGGTRRVFCECTTEEQASLAEAAGADGIIAKGSEAGGYVGEETTFVLVQRLAGRALPVWAEGGIGLHSAAACRAAGCAGIVVDAALALARESRLPKTLRAVIERMEGDETTAIGSALGDPFRLHRRSGTTLVDELSRLEQDLADDTAPDAVARWRAELQRRMVDPDAPNAIWPLGQDASLAAPLARRLRTVPAILAAYRDAIDSHLRAARELTPLAPDAPLARSHGTRYPILQGPMTRVSDTPEFAAAVADGGALPFLALALMRAPAVRTLLEATRDSLGPKPWGVGILGFVPAELREEQLEIIREIKPRFAIIAGGRPDQAVALEREGIHTYLHVPSPGLLRAFLEAGARRFIFEGRECGGHVGPRTSFVLWNTMVDVLDAAIASGVAAEQLHVVFAGGIHDARSAAMVAALAAPLAARGVRLGALLGTAYLLTEEAVASRAIVEEFQREALNCTHTVLFETGPGHAIRCAETPYFSTFRDLKRQLAREGQNGDEIREKLEQLNLGRLRIASKGVARDNDAREPRLVEVGSDQQHVDGMYMLGQVAALRHNIQRIADLHDDVSRGGSVLAQSFEGDAAEIIVDAPPPCDVAIVGMGCVLPGARDARAFWSNIVNKVDAITEVPRERFDADRYFDRDVKARDRIVSRWGGFFGDVPFDPVKYGIPPSALRSIDPLQLLALEVVHQALSDAGLLDRDVPRQRTSVILGASGGLGELGLKYGVRAMLPELVGESAPNAFVRLPEWTEDSFAGILLNVAAGRVANRFDFGGVNYTVDAACASSLAAVHLAVNELQRGTSDCVVVGGVDTVQSPFGYMCFSTSQALSPRGRCHTFDDSADGIAISEGVGALVLKRLADAERDGDRIYAVIKAVAGSSDGRGKGLTAPRPEGQARALARAYAQARIAPSTVGLIEAHGTGTVAGDAAEVAALDEVFRSAGAASESCAIGSVKSMIGHTKAAAGVAGLMKAALALHHRVVPPTLHVSNPNARLREDATPFFVPTDAMPWIANGAPRRAAVSSFGFGGTNFHAVLEEYTGGFLDDPHAGCDEWPAELFLWAAADPAALVNSLSRVAEAAARPDAPTLRSLAATLNAAAAAVRTPGIRLAIVASSADDLRAKLAAATEALAAGRLSLTDPRGIFLRRGAAAGAVAFLFPGQGSQSPRMLRDLSVQFDEIGESLHLFDRVLDGRLPKRLSAFIHPPSSFSAEQEQARADALTDTEVAQPALGAVEAGLIELLATLGVRPDMVAGHSYGEYVALHAAGVLDRETLAAISHLRGRAIKDAVGDTPGTMAAVSAAPEAIRAALGQRDDVWLVNFNAPEQTIIAGQNAAVDDAIAALERADIRARRIPVACAFHTPLMQGARERLSAALDQIAFRTPRVPVYSNALAAAYPDEPDRIAALLSTHLVSPVRFVEEIQAMHAAGARVFVEVGPKTVLTGLVRRILGDDSIAIAVDSGEKNGIVQLLNALGQLSVCGVRIDTARLFAGRAVEALDRTTLQSTAKKPAAAWLVNGAGVRPAAHRETKPQTAASNAPPAAASAPAPAKINPSVPQAAAVPPAIEQKAAPTSVAMDQSRPVPPSVAAAPGNGSGGDEVMLQFQQLMSRFLETQAAVMAAYLGGANGIHVEPQSVAEVPSRAETPRRAALLSAPLMPQVVAPAPPEQVVAASAPVAESVAPPRLTPATEPAKPAIPDFAALLVQVAAERTGYAPEMLDPDLSLEADLGIDSIKRVEILSAVRRQCSEADQVRLQPAMDKLTRVKTLRELASAMTAALAGNGANASAAPRAAAPEHAPAPAAAPRARGSVRDELLQIVAERTGYPQEMLDPDLNLEADLGIDSIKRVEILSTFRRARPEHEQKLLQSVMDRLTSRKTLRDLTRVIDETLGAPEVTTNTEIRTPVVASTVIERAIDPGPVGAVPRVVFDTVDAPEPAFSGSVDTDRLFLVTDDRGGVAREVCARLAAAGRRVLLLSQQRGPVRLEGDRCTADWTDAGQVKEALDDVRRMGAIGALIHLAPLSTPAGIADIDVDEWRERIGSDVRQLHLLVREILPDLRTIADRRGVVLAVTALGGDFGEDSGHDLRPSHGGVIGYLRTAAIELPEVRCRVVDVDPAIACTELAERVLAEAGYDGPLEIGYHRGRRITLVPRPAPLALSGAAPDLDANAVVLLTGGARGITAEIAVELARRFHSKLVLVGRSELSGTPSPWDGIDESSLKAAIAADMRRSNPGVRPVDVEATYRRVMADREIARTLETCIASGATVEYRQADVRDQQAFTAVVRDIYEQHGRLDLVIHGAGVIEDKLIADKTPESFDRVVHTKADSVFALARALRPDGLKALVLMSSVTAAFGNRGQADYGAANGIYNTTAQMLAAEWGCRVVALNWGPWDKRGMASEEVRKQFVARGIAPIEPAAGVQALVDEIASGQQSAAVVVLGDGPWVSQPESQDAFEVTA